MNTVITTVTITTLNSAGNAALMTKLGLIAVFALIAFLIARELLEAVSEQAELEAGLAVTGAAAAYPWAGPLSRALGVGSVPLLFVFGIIVLTRVMAIL